jgi:hypothetical protein
MVQSMRSGNASTRQLRNAVTVLLRSLRGGPDGDRLSATAPQLTVPRTIQNARLLHRQPDLDHVAVRSDRTGDFLHLPSISRISQGFADHSGKLGFLSSENFITASSGKLVGALMSELVTSEPIRVAELRAVASPRRDPCG